MKIHELRNRVSSLARNQMSAEQHNHHLQTLVNALDQLESGQSQEVSRLRRQFRWLCATTVTLALSLCLTSLLSLPPVTVAVGAIAGPACPASGAISATAGKADTLRRRTAQAFEDDDDGPVHEPDGPTISF